MKGYRSRAAVCLCATLILAATASPVRAQDPLPPPYQQVISANPFGLLLEFFNAEYERVVGASSTAGIGGSFAEFDNDSYLNADVFWRFYPQGRPLEGWAFGIKAGITRGDFVPDFEDQSETHFGFGFDTNWSWLLGSNDNFYVGLGFGLKRLLSDETDLEIIPTIRVVNIGFAF